MHKIIIKCTLSTFYIFLISLNSLAQLNERLKNAAENYSESKESSNSNESESNLGEGLFEVIFSGKSESSSSSQNSSDDDGYIYEPPPSYVELNKEAVPRITGFQSDLNFGPMPYNSLIFIPEFKYHWGEASTDLRLFSSIESSGDVYATLDLQLGVYHFVARENFDFHGGFGFMLDTYTTEIYGELVLGSEFYPNRIRIAPELRMAGQWATARTEFSTGIGYQLNRSEKNPWYANMKVGFARYYQQVDVAIVGFGLSVAVY